MVEVEDSGPLMVMVAAALRDHDILPMDRMQEKEGKVESN